MDNSTPPLCSKAFRDPLTVALGYLDLAELARVESVCRAFRIAVGTEWEQRARGLGWQPDAGDSAKQWVVFGGARWKAALEFAPQELRQWLKEHCSPYGRSYVYSEPWRGTSWRVSAAPVGGSEPTGLHVLAEGDDCFYSYHIQGQGEDRRYTLEYEEQDTLRAGGGSGRTGGMGDELGGLKMLLQQGTVTHQPFTPTCFPRLQEHLSKVLPPSLPPRPPVIVRTRFQDPVWKDNAQDRLVPVLAIAMLCASMFVMARVIRDVRSRRLAQIA